MDVPDDSSAASGTTMPTTRAAFGATGTLGDR